MAITKEQKKEMVDQYQAWSERSRAMILTDYIGLNMGQMEDLRKKIREAGGELHVVKNTLTKIALEQAGYPVPEAFFEGATAIGYAFEDAPGLAKALSEFAKDSEFVKIKGGYLGLETMTAEQIIALAELPPLPQMRARLLGTIMAPASQLARVISEPARQLAQVIKAYADQGAEAEAA